MRTLLPLTAVLLGSILAPLNAIDINTAWQRICDNSPELAMDFFEVEARNGNVLQASLYPNPAIAVEVDNVSGSRKRCIDDAQFAAVVTQPIVTGGKICKRQAVADSVVAEAEWDYEITKARLREQLERAFVDIGILQERYQDAIKSCKLANMALKMSEQLSSNGKQVLLQTKKASIELRQEEMHCKKLALELEQAKLNLALMWNSHCIDFETVEFPLDIACSPPDIDLIGCQIVVGPEVAKASALVVLAQQAYEVELAEKYPDFAVSAGYKNYWDCRDNAFVFAFSVPLPVFDRNQGNICKTLALVQKAEQNYTAICNQNMAALKVEQKKCVNAFMRMTDLKNGLLKEIEETLLLTAESFNQGKITLIELIDTQKIYNVCKADYLESLQDYYSSLISIAKLTGSSACNLP